MSSNGDRSTNQFPVHATSKEGIGGRSHAFNEAVTAPELSQWTSITLSRLIKEKGYKGAAEAHNSAMIHIDNARTIIQRGLDIMTTEQVGQWDGVRSWLEQ